MCFKILPRSRQILVLLGGAVVRLLGVRSGVVEFKLTVDAAAAAAIASMSSSTVGCFGTLVAAGSDVALNIAEFRRIRSWVSGEGFIWFEGGSWKEGW